MVSVAEVEAAALHLLAKLRFGRMSAQSFDEALKNLDLSRNVKRSLLYCKEALASGSSNASGTDVLNEIPPVQHDQNRYITLAMQTSTWEDFVQAFSSVEPANIQESRTTASPSSLSAAAAPQRDTGPTVPRGASPKHQSKQVSSTTQNITQSKPVGACQKTKAHRASRDPGNTVSPSHLPPLEHFSKAAKASLNGKDALANGYYGFQFHSKFVDKGAKREYWLCVYCMTKFNIPSGKNTNLAGHRKNCSHNLQPKTAGWPPYYPDDKDHLHHIKQARNEAGTEKTEINRLHPKHCNTELACRLGVIGTVMSGGVLDAFASPSHAALVASIETINGCAIPASGSTNAKVSAFFSLQKDAVKSRLRQHDSLINLQHDVWFTEDYQSIFVAVTAVLVGKDWRLNEILLSFKTMNIPFSADTFARNLVDVIADFSLGSKWSGIVICDSSSLSRNMSAILKDLIKDPSPDFAAPAQDEVGGPPGPAPSASSFAFTSRSQAYEWRMRQDAVFSFTHQVQIALRDGFKALGFSFPAQDQVVVVPRIDPSTSFSSVGPSGRGPSDLNNVVGLMISTSRLGNSPILTDQGENDDRDADIFRDQKSKLCVVDALGRGVVCGVQQSAMSSVQRLVGFVAAVHQSQARVDAFRKILHRQYAAEPSNSKKRDTIPPKPHDTQWTIQLPTLVSCLEVHEAIDAAISLREGESSPFRAFELSKNDWNNVKQLLSFMEFSQGVLDAAQDPMSTFSDVLEYQILLSRQLDKCLSASTGHSSQNPSDAPAQHPNGRNDVQEALKAIQETLNNHRKLTLESRTILMSTILNPRHRLRLFPINLSQHVERCRQILMEELKHLESPVSSPLVENGPSSVSTSAFGVARQQLQYETRDEECQAEVTSYLQSVVDASTIQDPRVWWQAQAQVYPRLSKLARVFLALPSTAMSTRAVRSRAAYVCRVHGGMISAQKLDILVTSGCWMQQGVDRLVGLDEETRAIGAPILARMDQDDHQPDFRGLQN
ncbi:hypothetical protein OC834_003889 [Tilletia horrida]|nr:hypothetical protein OC834_003889 [Tilletia horrida]